ncbi:MAG: threonine/serine exporter family protein [Eubacteriales bacterium]|nr:threonine/serine exporter family protein [Eubacteriales bacterium]
MTLAVIESIALQSIGAFAGTIGYALMLNAPGNTILPASLTAVLGYVIYAALHQLSPIGEIASYFVATVVISVICELAARRMRMPSTIFLLTALVPLVPGYTFYCMMLAMVENNGPAIAAYGLKAVQIVAVIAVGSAVTSVLFRTLTQPRIKRR